MIEGVEKVGVLAAQLMEKVEADSEPTEDEHVGEVMLLVEMRGTDEDGPYTYIEWRCSDEREWVQRGILHAGLDQERRGHPAEED
jgi:hypothetical protein